MRIALAQARAVAGDVEANVRNHLRLAQAALAQSARLVVFPELSITGYEPALCREAALLPGDRRLDAFQRQSDASGATLAVGAPTKTEDKPRISLVVFQPKAPRTVYSKHYLHADEEPFFSPGPRAPGIVGTAPRVGLAICYELSVPAHAEATFRQGADLYLASVANTQKGVETAGARLSALARQFEAPALMVNCIGLCDRFTCTGGSAVWRAAGERLAQLAADREGLLVFDTAAGAAFAVEA